MPPRNAPQNLPDPRVLLDKHNISIEGPIPPHKWPTKYAPLFALVRDMEKVRYEEYEAGLVSSDQRVIHVSKMCERVRKLVEQAYSLRKYQDNEYTWRTTTENLVLRRFEKDVDCHVCHERRWISDFQAVPTCPVAAGKLQRVRAARSLCRCSKTDRAKILADPSAQQLFVAKADFLMIDTAMLEIQKRILPHHKPDRVLGLRKTDDIKTLLEANPDITSAVTRNGTDLVFPFLVLEAKSEKDTDGFEAIERQTAFPIRAMVRIQKALESDITAPMDPLVWYVANRGDEWRVYACVLERSPEQSLERSLEPRIRIIDLWHGCVLRYDSALQLFLIMDLVCDWARDIFTEQVLCCLRQRAGLESSISMPQSYFEELPNADRSPFSDRSATLEHANDSSSDTEMVVKLEPADVMTCDVPDFTDSNMMGVEDMCPTTSPGDFPATSGDAPNTETSEWTNRLEAWMEHLAVKSDKDIQIQFRSISLPESADGAYPLIRAIGEPDIVHTARRLLGLFNLKDPLIVPAKFVDTLQRIWGKRELDLPKQEGPLLYASLSWRASFDYVDWVLTKELSCITASPTAIAALSTVGQVPPDHLLTIGGIKPTMLEKRLVHPLRYLPLAELVHAASRSQFLHLRACDGRAGPTGWTEDNETDGFSERFWESLDFAPGAFSECTRHVYTNVRGRPEVLKFCDDVVIPPPLQVPGDSKERSIALLRRPSDMGESIGQVYCIFVLDRKVVRSPAEIASAIQPLLRDGNSYFYGSDESVTATDRESLALLGSILEMLDPGQFVSPAL